MLVYCGQTAGWTKMKLDMEVDLGPGHIVFDGAPALPPQKKGHTLNFDPCPLWRGQTAGWIKLQLGMEVGLDPDDTVLDGDPAARP